VNVLPKRALIGMLHLPPLPGSPGSEWPMQRIIDYTCEDARRLSQAGFHALMVENFGDSPFRSTCVYPHTVACMAIVARAIVEAVKLPLGINVLRNDPTAALAIATIAGAHYIRVNVHSGVYATDQGIIEGRADETLRYRKSIGSNVAIFADVHVKHAQPLSCPDIAEAAEETAYRGRADGLIVSGTGTGKPTCLEDLRAVKRAVPDRPLLVGSGATPETAAELLSVADALIVGTAIKQGGRTTAEVDPQRARRFVDMLGT
jgi:uncharacterized protein